MVSAIRRDKPPEPPSPAETVLVVVMAALNHSQVEAFAQGKGVTDIEPFFSALEKSNLWDFARRPLDRQPRSRYLHRPMAPPGRPRR